MPKSEKNEQEKQEDVREIIIEKRSGFNTIEVVIIMLIAILFGGLIGSILTYTRGFTATSRFPQEFEEFVNTYNTILNNYYDKVTEKELLNSAIKGMVDSLGDPYSLYMDEDTSESFNETVNGEYVGIGTQVMQKDDQVVVYSVFSNSPASKAGIKKGDIVLSVSVAGKKATGKTLSEITNILKGKNQEETIKIQLKRGEKEFSVSLKRDTIDIPSVTKKVYTKNDQKVGVLTVDVFAANTYSQFKKKLEKLEKESIHSLIIDVRGNPGGHLEQVTKILSLFMKKNQTLYKIENKGKTEVIKDHTKENRNLETIILTNKSSASASEILASSMKEAYGAKVVGTATYGKGTVQNAFSLESGASIKYTTEKWLTPKGKSVDKKGVEPDVLVDLSEEYINNPSPDTDNQLQTALDLLTTK